MDLKQAFVVAVSGGIDSVVLLHKLFSHKTENIDYVVAHFDHGIRVDSHEDAELVESLARKYGFDFELGMGNLGAGASEQTARDARYDFLRRVASKYHAERIITAHHQDDVLETIVLNIVRGTGPRGLNPMQGQHDIVRPLLHISKKYIQDYAQIHKLSWREDSSNTDETYQRNYIRAHIMPKLEKSRTELLRVQANIADLYYDIDMRVKLFLPTKNVLHRTNFVLLPWSVRKELVRAWLLRSGVEDIDKQLVERIVIACMTLPAGKRVDISGSLWLVSASKNVLLASK